MVCARRLGAFGPQWPLDVCFATSASRTATVIDCCVSWGLPCIPFSGLFSFPVAFFGSLTLGPSLSSSCDSFQCRFNVGTSFSVGPVVVLCAAITLLKLYG